jgi:carbon-monoxide dehydrogenase medium subunit
VFVTPFRYARARSFAEACELLRSEPAPAIPIAGGQSLLPMVNLGLVEPATVVDLGGVREARQIVAEDGYLRIGALARHADLERDELVRTRQPLLADAVRWIGSPRVRARGTVGGSIAHADPVAEIPLAMTVLGASYELRDGAQARTVGASDFHLGPFTTARAPEELVAEIRVPVLGPGWGWGFTEVSPRLGDFAIVAAAALVRVVDGRIVEARAGLSGVAGRPIRIGAVEVRVEGARAEDLEDRVGEPEGLEPIDDEVASAEYRRQLARVLLVRALRRAVERAGGSGR